MAENFHEFHSFTSNLWPLSSPDLNPLDYYMWGIVKREVNKHPHNTISSLMEATVRAMKDIKPPDQSLQLLLNLN